MDSRNFPCSLGARERTVSIVVTGFLVTIVLSSDGVLALVCSKAPFNSDVKLIFLLVAIVDTFVAPVLFGILASCGPKSYTVDATGITITRRNGSNFIEPIGSDSSVEAIEYDVLKRSQVILAAQNFYGTWGRLRSKRLGVYRAYWTNRDTLVMVQREGQVPLVLSPDHRAEFMQYLNDLVRANARGRQGGSGIPTAR